MLIDHRAWERVGPFDPGYRLYFEEVDWLERVRRAGLAGRYVPAARAIHLYDRSAAAEPAAPGWFEESARRARRRHFGRTFAAGLEALDRYLPGEPESRASLPLLADGELALAPFAAAPPPLWIEVSPNATGYPAAAQQWTGSLASAWRLPAEVAERFPGRSWYVTLSDGAGRELTRATLPPTGLGSAGEGLALAQGAAGQERG